MSKSLIYQLLESEQTVFSFNEISMIIGENSNSNLKSKLNYYVKHGLLKNIRKGFYAKQNYNLEEFACKLYTPTYISMDYVLQNEGIIFQYNRGISSISYLNRKLLIGESEISYRKVKSSILYNLTGIRRLSNGINIATPERAIMDSLYLNKSGYFDNMRNLNFELMQELLEIYQSKAMIKLFTKTIKNV